MGAVCVLVACGSAPPTDHMTQTIAAIRAAEVAGAREEPKANLHLKLAEEQLDKAKQAVENDENEAAERLLLRSDADAELALSIARYASEKNKAEDAVQDSQEIKREANEEVQ